MMTITPDVNHPNPNTARWVRTPDRDYLDEIARNETMARREKRNLRQIWKKKKKNNEFERQDGERLE